MYKSHLEVLHEFIIPKVAVWILSTKQVFLKISQNSQQNTCARVFLRFQASNFVQRKLQHRCFLVNFAKFFSTSIFTECTNTGGTTTSVSRGVQFLNQLLFPRTHPSGGTFLLKNDQEKIFVKIICGTISYFPLNISS